MWSLDLDSVDPGDFKELIILFVLGKYDVCFKKHLSSVNKQIHASGTQGTGSLIGLLSRTTVNAVINAIKHLIKESISADVNKAGMFTVLLDTTQDITGKDEFCDFEVYRMQRP